ncbi:MAG: hypothetical protein IKQ17_06145 [Kiritimatiellae bacterium]|nr:hypothetical protein [Kiritimatiellia bacterium]
MKRNGTVWMVASVATAVALIGFAAASGDEKKDVSQKSSEASIVTNDNGSVSRSYTESTVTTNGNMVTERRRETRTTLDADGNILASSTSEYAQSYPVGDEGMGSFSSCIAHGDDEVPAEAKVEEGFLGLKFGEEFTGTNFVADAGEPTLLRAAFEPAKKLAGFDDYYVYVTPKTHKVVKVYACAKEAVDPGANWRRHYLIEALEKRYNTWARLRSWCRPIYTFDIGSGRFVTACLADASRDYGTVLVAWDDALLTTAADETEEIRREARKNAAEKRKARVDDAAAAF